MMAYAVGDRLRLNSLKQNEINRIKDDLRDKDLELDRKGYVVPKGTYRTNTGRIKEKSLAFDTKNKSYSAGSDEVLGLAIAAGERRQAQSQVQEPVEPDYRERAVDTVMSKSNQGLGVTQYDTVKKNVFVEKNVDTFPSFQKTEDNQVSGIVYGRTPEGDLSGLRYSYDKRYTQEQNKLFDEKIRSNQKDNGLSIKGIISKTKKIKDDADLAVSNVLFPYTYPSAERRFNPGRELDLVYAKEGREKVIVGYDSKNNPVLKYKGTKTFFDFPVLGETSKQATNYFMDKPVTVFVDYYLLKGAGKVAGSIPIVTKTLSLKPIRVLAGGAYASSLVVRADRDYSGFKSSLGETLVKEGTGFKALGSGLKSGSKTLKNLFRPSTKNLKVNIVEGVKFNAENKDYGGNVLDYDATGKPDIFGGQFKSQGGGLFNVKNRFFKVGFKESGKYVYLPEGGTVSRAKTDLNIQEYRYVLNPRNPLKINVFTKPKVLSKSTQPIKTLFLNVRPEYNRLPLSKSSANINTLSKFSPTDKGFDVDSLSIIKGKGQGFKRITKGELTNVNDFDSSFKGLSADFPLKGGFKNVRIGGSEKAIIGRSALVSNIQEGDLSRSFSTGRITSRNINRALSVSRKNVLKDIGSNVGKFEKDSFVDSANSLLGVKSVSKTAPQININQAAIKDVVLKEYVATVKADTLRSSFSAKPVAIARLQSQPKLSSEVKSFETFKPSSLMGVNNVVKTVSVPVVNTTPKSLSIPRSTFKYKQENFSKSKPVTSNINSVLPKQIPLSVQKVSSKQISKQITKQTYKSRFTSFKGFTSAPPIRLGGFDFKQFKSKPKVSSPLKIKSSFTPKYNPSIEASLFNIRAKKTNFKLANTGLVLRPILSR